MKKNSFYIFFVCLISVLVSSTFVRAQDTPASKPPSREASPEAPPLKLDEAALAPVPAEPAVKEDSSASDLEAKMVKSIEIQGNKTISLQTILSKIKTRVGQNYMQAVISDDLKRLYNTGYFSDVRVDRQDLEGGLKVIIYLTEKSIIEEITFSKTRYYNSKALAKKLKSQVGKFLDNKALKDDIDTIKELYAKKGLTSAEVDVETFIDDVTNKATLHFVVKEGHKIRIRHINVYGNNSYKDKRVIRVIKTRPKWLFIQTGFLKEDLLQEDMERITSFYEQNGFIDATAEYTIEQQAGGRVDININIVEGKRYSVGSLTIAGNQILSSLEIMKQIESTREGNVFSRGKLSIDIANIRTLYFDQGYIFANVTESTSLDSNTGKVDVTIDIVEGGLAYVEKVKIQGNTRTRDIVIRRELKMYPGDRFDGAKLRRSKERLNNLGYFEDVAFDIEDTNVQDRKDLVVQVKEAKTGTFSFGGGFSTIDRLIGFVEIEQKNFDFTNWPNFTGGGQNLLLRAETGTTRHNTRLSFTEPWIFDHPVSGGFDLYISDRSRERNVGYAYDEKRKGGILRFGKQFDEYLSGRVAYKLEKVRISDLESDVSADLLSEEGENTVSQIGFGVTRDTRDNVFSTNKGLILDGGIDVAGGALSGDKDFYRTDGSASYYIPLKFKSVLELRAHAGIVKPYGDSNKVPIFERYFAGGAKSIRGYNERKVGPLDSVTNDPIGGEALFVGNIEYTVPLIDFIKLAGFFDFGSVWADANDFASGDLKTGTGIGLRIKTPIGPVNLDYGYPLNDEPGEQSRSGKFYFSISRGF